MYSLREWLKFQFERHNLQWFSRSLVITLRDRTPNLYLGCRDEETQLNRPNSTQCLFSTYRWIFDLHSKINFHIISYQTLKFLDILEVRIANWTVFIGKSTKLRWNWQSLNLRCHSVSQPIIFQKCLLIHNFMLSVDMRNSWWLHKI